MAKLIPVAPLAKLRRNRPVCVEYRGVPYCVVKTRDGQVKSFVTVCTHKDLAMFPPDVKNGKLICPFHDAAFDAATGNVKWRWTGDGPGYGSPVIATKRSPSKMPK